MVQTVKPTSIWTLKRIFINADGARAAQGQQQRDPRLFRSDPYLFWLLRNTGGWSNTMKIENERGVVQFAPMTDEHLMLFGNRPVLTVRARWNELGNFIIEEVMT